MLIVTGSGGFIGSVLAAALNEATKFGAAPQAGQTASVSVDAAPPE
ncbi:MAG: hypothetical protein ACREFB_15360 [Stellaceae bacterium]